MIHKQDIQDIIKRRIREAEKELIQAADTDMDIFEHMKTIIGELHLLQDEIDKIEDEEEYDYDLDYDPDEMEYRCNCGK